MTRPSLRALLVLACALPCSGLLAACGSSGSDDSGASAKTGAQAALEQTFGAAATSVDRGRVVADVRLEPEGLLKLGGPLALRLTGPFAAPKGRTAPRFDLDFAATLGGRRFEGGALSTGTKSYLRLDDTSYGLGRVGRLAKPASTSHPALKALGVDPLRWVKRPRDAGTARVAGVSTRHIAGTVDAERVLRDVGALLDTVGGGAGSFLTPELRKQIADAVTSAKVDVWTGARDSILRRIAVDVRFAFKAAQSPIVGLDGGHLTLSVRLNDVNGAAVTVAAPAAARPLADVTGPGGLAAVLGGVGAGLTGGIDGGAIDLVGCVTGAGGSSVELLRCVAKLAP